MNAAAHQRIDGIDFWRGFVLLSIFVNHAPENLVAHITHRNFGLSDAAEAFVFLSGLSVALAYGNRFLLGEYARALGGLYRRALTLYGVQIAISVAGIVFLAAAAYLLDSDDLTDDSDRAVLLEQPWQVLPAMLALIHQLAFFNILPLYIVFLLATPLFLLCAKLDRRLMLLASAAIYLAAHYFGLQGPTWPLNTGWFFNPFAWQFIFVIGLFIGLRVREGVSYDRIVFAAALLVLAGSLLLTINAGNLPSGWWTGLAPPIAEREDQSELAAAAALPGARLCALSLRRHRPAADHLGVQAAGPDRSPQPAGVCDRRLPHPGGRGDQRNRIRRRCWRNC